MEDISRTAVVHAKPHALVCVILSIVIVLTYALTCAMTQDNTLTAPYADDAHHLVEEGLRRCMEAFEGRVCIMSNSAGTRYVCSDESWSLRWHGTNNKQIAFLKRQR